jgi:hypothetical protein
MFRRGVFHVPVLFACVLLAQDKQPVKRDLEVKGQTPWVDSGIDVKAGDQLVISSTGTMVTGSQSVTPDGGQRNWKDLLRTFPLNDSSRCAVIGRIGTDSRAFLIGSRRESRAPIGGRLFIGLNLPPNEIAEGSFKVSIEKIAGVEAKPLDVSKIKKLTQAQLDSLPPRVVDDAGTQGDRVNFLIVGSEEQVRSVLAAAGWTAVDKTVKDTILRGALASLSRQAYTTLPMSELRMFDRSQDFAYAQGDPVRVVAARHHFRLWRAPFTLDGNSVWVGAGTHDIGFDKDQRNGKLTHRIDSDVDGEREYIGKNLEQTGMVALLDYMTPKVVVKTAKTAHGEEFFSDGRTLVIYMRPEQEASRLSLGDAFCTVLRKENPDTGEWGKCTDYFQGGGKEDLDFGPMLTNYRVLIVPGFMSSCFSDAPAFQEGQEHLRSKGVAVDLLPVSNDGSEENARLISEYLAEQTKKDPRKFIVLGYSKGTPDVQVALASYPQTRSAVAAFVSVAGASGGSPIADSLPAAADRWINQFKLDKCKGDITKGFRSLRRDVRQAFLSSYPHPFVPTYSIVALSSQATTSKALLQTWELLRIFDSALDGQLTKPDAIIPEGKYLGAALADHFGIALPFDKSSEEIVRSNMGTRYPRAALFEAIVRVVSEDLKDSSSLKF